MILSRAETNKFESNLVRVWKDSEGAPPSGNNLLNIEPNQECKRDIAHKPSGIDTDQLKHFFLVRMVYEDKAVEEAKKIIQADKDDEVVVDELDNRPFPFSHKFEESGHTDRGVLVLVLVDVLGIDIFLINSHVGTFL